MRMRVMDGVLKALRMRINGAMEAGAAIPLAERRRQFPFTPMATGTLLLTLTSSWTCSSVSMACWTNTCG